MNDNDKKVFEQMETPHVEIPVEASVQVHTPPNIAKPIKTVKDNLVLRKLKETFGIEKLKTEDVEINGVTFTLKALTAGKVEYASSLALSMSINPANGNYSLTEYQSKLETNLAAMCVTNIDGQTVEEVFESKDNKLAYPLFIDFLNASLDGISKKIRDAYDKKIEPFTKIQASTDILAQKGFTAYKCPTCEAIEAYETREEAYFCHKDGSQLDKYEMEGPSAPL